MRKAFSLMEVLIATALLSVVMLSLFQIKENNIFILEKSKESEKQNTYLSLLMDTKEYSKRNENIYLDKHLNIKDTDIRRELKEIKIKVKDEILDTSVQKLDNLEFKIIKFKTIYSFEKDISKEIYRFKIEL